MAAAVKEQAAETLTLFGPSASLGAMQAYLLIAAGGALGSIARYWMANAIDGRHTTGFPWGTVMVNILGSFVIGMAAALVLGRGLWTENARLFVMMGVCGGFTTFSTFSLQTLTLLRDGLILRAGGNIAVSVIACLLATWAGLALVQALERS